MTSTLPNANPLGNALNRLKRQVIETRAAPAPAGPGESVASDIYAAAEDARIDLRPQLR